MKKYSGTLSNFRIYTFLSVLLTFLMVVTLLPHEILAQELHQTNIVPTIFSDEIADNTDVTTPTPTDTPLPTETPVESPTPPLELPEVTTIDPPIGITNSTAMIQGSLSSLGSATKVNVWFEYGEDDTCELKTDILEMDTTGTFSINLLELKSDTLYYFRAKASNEAGEVTAAETSFNTLIEASPSPEPNPTETPTPSPTPEPTATPTPTPAPNSTIIDLTGKIDNKGYFTEDITLTSADNIVQVVIPSGTKGTNKDKEPLTQISLNQEDAVSNTLLDNSDLIGIAYTLNPKGAIFKPVIHISFDLNQVSLPDGIFPSDLSLAIYNEEQARWIPLESALETDTENLSAQFDQFGRYALIGGNLGSDTQKSNNQGRVVTTEALPDQDTEIISSSRKIKLKIPKEALSAAATIELIEEISPASTGMQMIKLFELNARDSKTQAEVTKFNKNLEISIQNDDTELRGVDLDSLHLYYLDEKTLKWVLVSDSRFDKEQNILTASTTHFSNYGEMADLLNAGPGRVMAAQVDLHSGASIFSYPIELPPGPGGFKPKLELMYNSASVDEMKNKQDVGSWVGIGWSLHLGRINYDSTYGKYYLDLNGGSYELVTTDGTNYNTKPEQYYKIVRTVSSTVNKWEVWDKDGTYYLFGGTSTSHQDAYQYLPNSQYYQWDLSLMQDPNGNQATVTYARDIITTATDTWVRSAYPQTLTYNNGLIEVDFNTSWDLNDTTDNSSGYLRFDNPRFTANNPAPKIMEDRRLDSIMIKVNGNVIRQYNFIYSSTNAISSTDYTSIYYGGQFTLKSIIQVGGEDSTSPIGQLNLPKGIAVDNTNSYTYVTDYYNNRIQRFDLSGGNPSQFASSSQFAGPMGIATDGSGNVYICDTGNNRILKFNPSGTLLNQWGSLGSAAGQFNAPTGITVTSSNVYVADSGNNRIQRFALDGTNPVAYGSYGTLGDATHVQFIAPTGVAVDSSGYIYVCDCGNNRIMKLTSAGAYSTKWGTYGTSTSQFSFPKGIAVSGSNVYVVDTGNNRGQKFTLSGTFVSPSFGSYGTGDVQFISPIGIALDSSGNLYICDSGNNRVQKTNSSYALQQQWGNSGSTLPPMSFSYNYQASSSSIYYHDNTTYSVIYSGNPGNPTSRGTPLSWSYLSSINSGYGGTISFTYAQNPSGTYGTGSTGTPTNIWTRETVTGKTVNSGIGANQYNGYTYTGSPQYFGTGWLEQYRGFGQVKETSGQSQSSDTPTSYVKHYFYTTAQPPANDEKLTGKEYQTQWYKYVDGTNDTILKEVDNIWVQNSTLSQSEGSYAYQFGASYLNAPKGVAVAPDGGIYVANFGDNNVKKFTADRSYSFTFPNTSYLDGPAGIAIAPDGYVYVASYNNSLLLKYKANGDYVTSSGSTLLSSPTDIAITPDGSILVASSGNNKIVKFNADGTNPVNFITTNLTSPRGIGIAPDGTIFVSSYSNNYLGVFAPTGTYITQYTNPSPSPLSNPMGVAVSADGSIYVVSYTNSRIVKFTFNPSTNTLAYSGSYFTDSNINNPTDIVIDNHYLYVTSSNASTHCIVELNNAVTNWNVQLTRVDQVDEATGAKTSRTSYAYDNYGNIITEYREEDITTTDDDSTIWRIFNANTAANILDKPARERTYATIVASDDGGSNLRKETSFYYDGSYNPSTGTFSDNDTQTPSKGNLTRLDQKIDASTAITARNGYDSYGNKIAEKEPNNNLTKWTIETTYYTYPATKTYPTVSGGTFTESYSYDPGTNNLLSQTDINGQTTSYVYDTFKRLIQVNKPGSGGGGSSGTFGLNNGTGNISSSSAELSLSKFQNTVGDGIVTELEVSMYNIPWPPTNCKMVIYADNGSNHPGQLLGYTQVSNISSGWVSSPDLTSQNIQVSQNAYYWLGVCFDSNSYINSYSNYGTNTLAYTGSWNYNNSWPSDFSGQSFNFYNLATVMRATVSSSGSIPSIQYQYNSWGTINQQNIKTITTIDDTHDIWQADYFDGLGRVVQTQSQGEPKNTYTIISSTTAYNNRGLVDKKYVSQDINSTLTSYYTIGIANWKYTGYAYDGLGRITTQTNPDGTTSSNDYSTAWQTTSTNERGYKNIYSYDAFGRLTIVQNKLPAVLITEAATSITGTTATLNGNLTSLGSISSVTVSFEYGTTTSYGSTKAGTPPSRSTPGTFTGAITSLSSGTTYHYRTKAVWNSVCVAYGNDQTFTTGGTSTAPTVSTGSASNVAGTSATLNGNLTALGTATSVGVCFEYGLTTSYGSSTTYQPMTAAGAFSAPITGLAFNTTYHFRAKAAGNGGTTGLDQTFTTGGNTFGLNSGNGNAVPAYPNACRYMRFQNADGAGILTQLELLFDQATASGKVRMGVYSDNNGSVGTKLLDTGEIDCGTSWVIKNNLNLAVANGTYYWLAFAVSASNTVRNQSGQPANSHAYQTSGYTWGQPLPQTPTVSGANSTQYVIRATISNNITSDSTNYSYDVLGNLIKVVDNNGNTTAISYDWLSRKTGMQDPDMGTWAYGYDNNSNLTSQTDNKGQTISLSYDALNRLTGKTYPAGSGMTNVTYTYDATSGGNYGKGKRTSMNDALGTSSSTFKYDNRGRLIQEGRTVDTSTYTTQYAYDSADRLYQISYPTTPIPEVVTYGYNDRGLPKTLSSDSAGSLVDNALYNNLGNLTEIDLHSSPSGLKTTFSYWGIDHSTTSYGRLWEIKTTASGGSTIQDLQYTWDNAGNLTQRQDLYSSETENFTYDYLDRLTAAAGPYYEACAYDLAGNITYKGGSFYTYGKPHAVVSFGSTSYAYDNNGNMTNRGSQTLTWDVENRLSTVSGGSSYIYDGDGNRVKEVEGTSTTTIYINKYYEKKTVSGVSEITTHYYLGDKEVALRKGTTLSYLYQDSLGSTALTSDTSGSNINRITYYPFGLTRTSGTLPTDKEFTGQRLDGTGLYYYGARYYDPQIGRFISPDTIVPHFTNPQSLNRYSYCRNNPLKYNDPTGHMDDWDLWIPDSNYYDYLDAYQYGFEESYSDWQRTGSPTVTINGAETTITISGQFEARADVATLANFERPEKPELEFMKEGTGSDLVSAAGGIFTVIDQFIYYWPYLRTDVVSEDISFFAKISYNSEKGFAKFYADISCDSSYFGCAPYIVYNGSASIMSPQIAWNSKNSSSYVSNIGCYLPGLYDARSTFLSNVKMQLTVEYGNGTGGRPGGVKIDFGKGTWSPYYNNP